MIGFRGTLYNCMDKIIFYGVYDCPMEGIFRSLLSFILIFLKFLLMIFLLISVFSGLARMFLIMA